MSKKKWKSLFMGLLAMSLFAGCSSDDLVDGGADTGSGSPVSKDAVYMNVAVQLPSGIGTRSATDTPDKGDYGTSTDKTEVGKDYENEVKKVLLVLADKDNKFIAYGTQEGQSDKTNGQIATVQKISKSTLSEYYGSDKKLTSEEREIYVYAFCNPTDELETEIKTVNKGDTEWINKACTVNETPETDGNISVWGGKEHQNGFLMSTASASKSKKTLPEYLDDWNSYTSVDKAFNLSGINNANSDKEVDNRGTIPVERAVARFDFKDGSPEGNNTYVVIKSKTTENDPTEKVLLKIQLEKMALVNMSKQFHYLRRVSADGLNTNAIICGTEYNGNYVVDVDAQAKKDGSIISNMKYGDHFNFCMGHVNGTSWSIDNEARKQWYTSTIADVLKGTQDEHENWDTDTNNKGDYRIWRYVTENTIPGSTNQVQGISTGIIFRGKMVAGEGLDADAPLKKALDEVTGNPDDAILYAYSNNLYVRWTEVRKAALEAGEGDPFYKAAFGTPKNAKPSERDYSDDTNSPDYLWNEWYNQDKTNDDKLLAFKQAATTAKFTIYQSSNEGGETGYYCYYFYKNRHNDNGNDGVMGPMEFAVVRNNVYKLAVTKIDRLGHPRNSDDDPDPLDPEDPDEKGDAYITLSVEVWPWVVRINNIEF